MLSMSMRMIALIKSQSVIIREFESKNKIKISSNSYGTYVKNFK